MFKATADSPRMFASDFIDFFSRTHFMVVPVLYVPATVFLLYWSYFQAGVGLLPTAALFGGGFLAWTLSEYWLHRTFFHWHAPGRWGKRLHFLVHGVHHRWPKDKYRLVMPPAVSITLFWLSLGAAYAAFGTYGWALHAGFTLGYMYYDVTHYCIHHVSPKTEWGRQLKKHHLRHHFKDGTRGFGVSMIIWDRVFGTDYRR